MIQPTIGFMLERAIDGFLEKEVLPHVFPGTAGDGVGQLGLGEPGDVVRVLGARVLEDRFFGHGDLGTAGRGEDFGDVVDVEVRAEGLRCGLV